MIKNYIPEAIEMVLRCDFFIHFGHNIVVAVFDFRFFPRLTKCYKIGVGISNRRFTVPNRNGRFHTLTDGVEFYTLSNRLITATRTQWLLSQTPPRTRNMFLNIAKKKTRQYSREAITFQASNNNIDHRDITTFASVC